MENLWSKKFLGLVGVIIDSDSDRCRWSVLVSFLKGSGFQVEEFLPENQKQDFFCQCQVIMSDFRLIEKWRKLMSGNNVLCLSGKGEDIMESHFYRLFPPPKNWFLPYAFGLSQLRDKLEKIL